MDSNLIKNKRTQRVGSILGSFGDQATDAIDKTRSESIQLSKAHKIKLESAVGIVFCNGYILMGLAKADDERDGKWCFPGGGIEDGEDCLSASIRETYEEMGVTAHPVTQLILTHPIKPMVGFCVLQVDDMNMNLNFNEEFHQCKWFSINQLPDDMLSINRDILDFLRQKL